MKKKLKRQKLWLGFKIFTVMLVMWLALSSAFAVIRFGDEKEKLIEGARYSAVNSWLEKSAFAGNGTIWLNALIHSVADGKSAYVSSESYEDDVQIKIIRSFGNEEIIDSNNVTSVTFGNGQSNYSESGWLDFEQIRASVSDPVYNEICSYLRQIPPEGGSYELACTEYAVNWDGGFEPVTLEIIRSEDWHKWRVDDETVKTYKTNFKPGSETVYQLYGANARVFDEGGDELESTVDSAKVDEYKRAIGSMDRNIIPKDFFLRDKVEDYIGALTKPQKKEIDMYMDTSGRKGNCVFDWNGFDCVLYNVHYFYVAEDPIDENSGEEQYKMFYAKRLRVLDSCLDDIIRTTLGLLVIFTVMGAVIYIISWRSISRQLKEEQKRRDMTNALAHDIKTPLFVIGGYAQNLKDNVHTDKRDHYASVILSKTDEVNNMVHRMLELGKLDAVNYKLSVQNFDFAELTSEVLQNYSILPDGKFVDADCREEILLSADRELMKCLLENLIDNAVKYADPDTGITLGMSAGGFEISNCCPPVSKAELKRLWEPYARADKARKNGNGLGLSIVKSICDLHGFPCGSYYRDGRVTYFVRF